jgi:hypothetical protein
MRNQRCTMRWMKKASPLTILRLLVAAARNEFLLFPNQEKAETNPTLRIPAKLNTHSGRT